MLCERVQYGKTCTPFCHMWELSELTSQKKRVNSWFPEPRECRDKKRKSEFGDKVEKQLGSCAWWFTPAIPAPWNLKQENCCELKASLEQRDPVTNKQTTNTVKRTGSSVL